jgi:teichoic acid transport system permease protein
MIVRDYQLALQSIMRMSFFLLPLFWNPRILPYPFDIIVMLNPVFYLIEGFRFSFLGGGSFMEDPFYTLYFWGVTILILFLGAVTHVKLRNRFVDYL